MALKFILLTLAFAAVSGAPCGPETLIWLGKSNIEGSKMEFPPTDGQCYEIKDNSPEFWVKICGPGAFKLSPYSCRSHGSYATGDINESFEAGQSCKTLNTYNTKFGHARQHSGGGSYTVHC